MRRLPCLLLLIAVYACAEDPQAVAPTHPELLARPIPEPVYELETFDETLGGVVTVGTGINNRGWIAGYSRLADGTRHAVLSRNGELEDLETLGGPNSAVHWPGINNRGMLVGISLTAEADPHNANWSCEAFIGAFDRTCRGFYWEGNGMKPLETLGGYNGFATVVNNQDQIVGWAETSIEDRTCKAPQVPCGENGCRAFLYEKGVMYDLNKLLDPQGATLELARHINDAGVITGNLSRGDSVKLFIARPNGHRPPDQQ